jgi:diguanylate cyclase (GGDEF)-like protein
VLQSRDLSADLERAARERLARAASAADRLLESHLDSLAGRYRSVSETPEFRANLESGHAPTLRYFAEELAAREGASAVVFVDEKGRRVAAAGSEELAETMLARPEEDPPSAAAALEHGSDAFAVADVPLRTRGRSVGRLLAAEPIGDEQLALWSELCGMRVAFAPTGETAGTGLFRPVRSVGSLELRVASTLDAERDALLRARRNLFSAGAVTLIVAFGASLLVSRGLVRPIREIQDATEPIGRGELGVRLAASRRDEIGDVSRAFNVMIDRLEGTLSALQRSQRRLANAQHLARLGSFGLDLESGELQVSDELRRILELSPEGGPLSRQEFLARIHPGDRDRFGDALARCATEGTPFRLDHRSAPRAGQGRFLHSQGERVTGDDGAARVEGTVQDITDRRLVEEQVRYLAYHDSLTGLGNRQLLAEHLQASIQDARAYGGALGVLLLDLDGFKLVNETFGHSVGDRLLRAVAERLVGWMRTDATGPAVPDDDAAAVVARLGGDEFAVLLPRIGAPEEAGRTALRILRGLEAPVDLDGHELVASGSIGIATWPLDGDDAETLLRNCDTAMYHAKERGRNNYQFYSEAMNGLVFRRLVLENKLRKAIERDELELHFQPKVELASGRVCGLEALARWRDPELGVVSPADFIPLAEEAGLIGAIGEWVLRTALRQVRTWRRRKALAGLRVSVNLSGHQLASADFADHVARALQETRVDPQLLDLEITETAVMRNDASVVRALERLRGMGTSVSLDDFGTGYSSLSYLRNLPIDTLKIDRSFVSRVEAEPDDTALLGAIVSMAKVLRLRVVVEGVETEGQLAILRELGCDEVQGNLLSPPVAAADAPRAIREIEADRRKKPARRGAARRRTRH